MRENWITHMLLVGMKKVQHSGREYGISYKIK